MSFSKILLRVNVAAFTIGAFEAAMGYAFTAYAARAMGAASDANILLFWFWLALFVLELPTGYLVDKWGPKRALVCSLGLRAIAFGLYWAGKESIWILCLASLLSGAAVTFMSGLFSTQILVWATAESVEPDTKRMMRWIMAVRASSLIAGTLLGYAVVSLFDLDAVWLLCVLMCAVAAGYAGMTWSNVTSRLDGSMGAHYRECVVELSRHRLWSELLAVSVVRIVSTAAMANAAMVLVPGLERTPVLLLLLALLIGCLTLISPALQGLVERQQAWRQVATWMFLPALIVLPLLTALAAWVVFVVMTASVLSAEMHYRSRFYDAIDASIAGSASSIQGVIENGLGALIFAGSWLFLRDHEVQFIWLLYAGVVVVFSCIPLLVFAQHRPVPVHAQEVPEP